MYSIVNHPLNGREMECAVRKTERENASLTENFAQAIPPSFHPTFSRPTTPLSHPTSTLPEHLWFSSSFSPSSSSDLRLFIIFPHLSCLTLLLCPFLSPFRSLRTRDTSASFPICLLFSSSFFRTSSTITSLSTFYPTSRTIFKTPQHMHIFLHLLILYLNHF